MTTGASSSHDKRTGCSITRTIAPRDGPSLQPDQGDGIKTRLMNQACSKAATASGTLNMYFIPVAPPSCLAAVAVGLPCRPALIGLPPPSPWCICRRLAIYARRAEEERAMPYGAHGVGKAGAGPAVAL